MPSNSQTSHPNPAPLKLNVVRKKPKIEGSVIEDEYLKLNSNCSYSFICLFVVVYTSQIMFTSYAESNIKYVFSTLYNLIT